MASRRGSRVAASRSVAFIVAFAIVAAVALGGGWLAYRSGELNRFICSGDCGPAYVVPPAGVVSASAKPMPQLADPTTSAVSAAAVRAAVAPLLGVGGLGENVGFASFDLGSGLPLWAANDTPLVPASTTKVLTMFTALSVIAPRTRFATTVRASAGKVTLVGGGDPYLLAAPPKKSPYPARADLGTLAAKTAQALKAASTTKVALSYDDSLFTGPAASPSWRSSYVPSNIVSPVSALWVDEGRVNGEIRAKVPAEYAAQVFAAALRKRGIDVTAAITKAPAPSSSPIIATVRSAPFETIVETALQNSDNEASEVMLRQAAIAAGKPASFEGGIEAVRSVLAAAGLDTTGLVLGDGSGLARGNRISPTLLSLTITTSQDSGRTAGLVAGFPVAGFNGTLTRRFQGDALEPARGDVRAKTGSLTGVTAMAGVVEDAQGHGIAFAVMADQVPVGGTLGARAALDQIASALASCSCGAAS